jgi:hypothetical protein
MGIVPKSSVMFSTQDLVVQLLTPPPLQQQYTDTDSSAGFFSQLVAQPDTTTSSIFSWYPSLVHVIAGFASGIPEAIVVNPFQVIKIRMQSLEHLNKYASISDCFARTLRDEGVAAFTIGLGPTLARNCVWNTVYFGTMYKLKQALPG